MGNGNLNGYFDVYCTLNYGILFKFANIKAYYKDNCEFDLSDSLVTKSDKRLLIQYSFNEI